MPLTAGTRLGPYEVIAPLGAGGMGEVYRARDTRLKREVALKVLPASVAADADRLARFQREAELLASLNHPHIAHVHGIEEAPASATGQSGMRALVMELVPGESLASRLTRGPLPLDEAVALARQIADALEAAHERGIIHRDLKPANIMVTPDQLVKVLDFGLAKAIEAPAEAGAHAPVALTQSPTMTSPAHTNVGVILGTAAYMSPEQAKGRPVGKRADVWAFGCVMFEMLTGRRAFEGESVTETLAAILKTEPTWSLLPADVPASLRSFLEGCLEKDPRRRVADIAVATFLFDQPIAASAAVAAPIVHAKPARFPWRAGIGLLIGAAAGAAAMAALGSRTVPPAPAPPSRFRIATSPSEAPGRTGGDHDIAISPDGRHFAYVGSTGDLFLRDIDRLDATALPGLRGSRGPFFSPDSQWLGFADPSGLLRKIPVAGGAAVTICPVNAGGSRGATWLDDGTIVFATNEPTGLLRVAASGGTPSVLTTPAAASEADHLWPHVVPGRRAVLFTASPLPGSRGSARTLLLDLGTNAKTIVLEASADAHYLASGHLVYLVPSAGLAPTLRATAFDLEQLKPIGESLTIGNVTASAALGGNFDVSTNGTLLYSPGTASFSAIARTLAWVDRQGHEEPLKAPTRAYLYPRISPDFSRVALDARDEESDIWIWDFVRQTMTRLTTDPSPDRFPVWTPDGESLLFTSEREGQPNVYRQRVAATTPAERISSGPNTQAVMSVAPDGRFAVVRESTPTADLMLLPLAGDTTLKPLIKTTFIEQNGEVSPDGRWIAYESNESGRFEIYVRPFPDVDRARWQVSNAGGVQPMWSRDGRELFFAVPNNAGPTRGEINAVRVDATGTWRNAAPDPIRVAVTGLGNAIGGAARTYDIGQDGRFLVFRTETTTASQDPGFGLAVVMNWMAQLKRETK